MATQSTATGLALGRESDPSAASTESAIFNRLKTSALLLVSGYPEIMNLEHVSFPLNLVRADLRVALSERHSDNWIYRSACTTGLYYKTRA